MRMSQSICMDSFSNWSEWWSRVSFSFTRRAWKSHVLGLYTSRSSDSTPCWQTSPNSEKYHILKQVRKLTFGDHLAQVFQQVSIISWLISKVAWPWVFILGVSSTLNSVALFATIEYLGCYHHTHQPYADEFLYFFGVCLLVEELHGFTVLNILAFQKAKGLGFQRQKVRAKLPVLTERLFSVYSAEKWKMK